MIFLNELRRVRVSRSELAPAGFDEVLAGLYQAFDTWDDGGYVDRERLWPLGGLVGRSRHASPEVERAALSWQSARPSVARRTVVAAFLAGYWRVAPEADGHVKDALVAWLTPGGGDGDDDAATLEALAQLYLAPARPLPAGDRSMLGALLAIHGRALRERAALPGTAALLGFVERDLAEAKSVDDDPRRSRRGGG